MRPKVWLIAAPCESEFLGYTGEPTSILYAAAVLWDAVKKGLVPTAAGGRLTEGDVRLFAWRVAGPRVLAELEAALRADPPRVVCVSTTTPAIPYALRIAELVKRIAPDALVIFGGPHEDAIHRVDRPGAKRFPVVDLSVAGDGEFLLHALVATAVAEPRSFSPAAFVRRLAADAERFLDVPGDWHLTARPALCGPDPRRARRTPLLTLHADVGQTRRPLPPNLPRLPRDLLVRDRPHMARGFDVFGPGARPVPTAQIITARGCSWRCSFCTEWRGAYTRSVEDVMAEIHDAMLLGYGAIFFDDSTFFTGFGAASGAPAHQARYHDPDRQAWVRQLLAELRRIGIEWGCQTRVDTLDDDILAEARQAGCTYIYFGAESASEEQLADMQKWQSRNDIASALDRVRRAGIRVGLSMLFCTSAWNDVEHTRETELSVATTLAFFGAEVRKGGISVVSRNIMAYYPGTVRTPAVNHMGIDLWDGMPLAHGGELPYPWNRFEDGGGHHARNVTRGLAAAIVAESERVLGPWLVKAYIHAHRVPELESPGAPPPTDLVHYTAAWDDGSDDPPRPTFAEALAGAVAEAAPAVAPATATVAVGMHLLDAIRRFVYPAVFAGPAAAPAPTGSDKWYPLWLVENEDGLMAEFDKVYFQNVAVVAVPAVLPETGLLLDLDRVGADLQARGFRGSLICDLSDLPHAAADRLPWRFDGKTVFLTAPERIWRRTAACERSSVMTPAVVDPHDAAAFEVITARARAALVSGLRALPCAVTIVGERSECHASHILAVRFPHVDQFTLTQRLWRDRNVFTTFIGPMDLIRFQFGEQTTLADIESAVAAIEDLLPECHGGRTEENEAWAADAALK